MEGVLPHEIIPMHLNEEMTIKNRNASGYISLAATSKHHKTGCMISSHLIFVNFFIIIFLPKCLNPFFT